MPTLDLKALLNVENLHLVWSYISGVMLYPESEDGRGRLADATLALSLRKKMQDFAKLNPPRRLEAAFVAQTFETVAKAPRMVDLEEDIDQRYARGTIAGQILREYLDRQHSGIKLGTVKQEISERFRGRKHFEHLSVSTINNSIWPIFGPVSHMWLAETLLGLADFRVRGEAARPLTIDNFVRFLRWSEQLRRDGERCRPRQAAQTVLDPAKTWKAPTDLEVPEFKILYGEVDRSKPC